jgi:transposase
MLGNFKGYLQTDGYAVYEKYGKKKGVTHLACWAHARREFEKALDNDKQRAEKALLLIQKLYAVERQAKQGSLSSQQIKELRLAASLPVINELGKWIFEEIKTTLPKSQIGKAMAYAYARWDALSAYLYDGNLQIDNNLVENAIRPVSLGRKNYLFAGSHEAAQRAAMIYSFFAICKKHEVNPFRWLKLTLQNIMSVNHKNIKDLYPQNYKQIIEQSNM